MKSPLVHVSEIETELRSLLTEVVHLVAEKRTSANINRLHRIRTRLAEACAEYDNEFSNFQLHVDACVHPAERPEIRDRHYRAQVLNEPYSRQTRMRI